MVFRAEPSLPPCIPAAVTPLLSLLAQCVFLYPPFFSNQPFVLVCSLGHVSAHARTSLSWATGVFCFFPQSSSEASAISPSTLPSFMLGTLKALVFGSHLVVSLKQALTLRWAMRGCRGLPWPDSVGGTYRALQVL